MAGIYWIYNKYSYTPDGRHFVNHEALLIPNNWADSKDPTGFFYVGF